MVKVINNMDGFKVVAFSILHVSVLEFPKWHLPIRGQRRGVIEEGNARSSNSTRQRQKTTCQSVPMLMRFCHLKVKTRLWYVRPLMCSTDNGVNLVQWPTHGTECRLVFVQGKETEIRIWVGFWPILLPWTLSSI